MRILILVDWFPALSETHILNRIIGLIERGHSVEILANGPGETSLLQPDIAKYNLDERVTYYRLPHNRIRNLAVVFRSLLQQPVNGALWKAAWDLACRRGVRRAHVFHSAAALAGTQSYDIIQCEFGPLGLTALRLKELGVLKGKLITSFRGYDITGYVRARPHVYDRLFANGDHFLPVCDAFRQKLLSIGCMDSKITVQPAAIDLTKLIERPAADDNAPIRVVTVGRLSEQKGIEYGIRAVAQLIGKGLPIQYEIIGDGPLRAQLNQLIETLLMQNQIHLLGWRTQSDIFCKLATADILMAPSITADNGDQEGVPNVLLEGMSSGIPVISTRHSGIPELIEHGVNGLLAPERSIDDLADLLERLIKEPETRRRIAKSGRDFVLRSRSLETLNDRLVEIYQRVVDGE